MKKHLFAIIGFILIPIATHPYEVNVHRQLLKKAMAISSAEVYLRGYLYISLDDKFGNGISNEIEAKIWLENGSDWEDNTFDTSEPYRYMNHF